MIFKSHFKMIITMENHIKIRINLLYFQKYFQQNLK